MLVLSRKLNQKVQIGDDIVVTVVKVKGNVIRLGIEAPKDVRVLRSELQISVDKSLTEGLEPEGNPTAGRRPPLASFCIAMARKLFIASRVLSFQLYAFFYPLGIRSAGRNFGDENLRYLVRVISFNELDHAILCACKRFDRTGPFLVGLNLSLPAVDAFDGTSNLNASGQPG